MSRKLRIHLRLAPRLRLRPRPAPPPCPPPPGAPLDFRQRLVRALRTTDPDVLRDAEDAYRGVYDSAHAYIVERVTERVQSPDIAWLLAACHPDRLREVYEGTGRLVWSIALDHGKCMIFESARESPELSPAP